jgi:hypothetical protein
MVTFTGEVIKIEVEDKGKTATVTLNNYSDPPKEFEVTKDSDTGFLAMVSVLSMAAINWSWVTVEYDTGNNKIDKVIF